MRSVRHIPQLCGRGLPSNLSWEWDEELWLSIDFSAKWYDRLSKRLGYTPDSEEMRKWNAFDTLFLMHELAHVHAGLMAHYGAIRDQLKNLDNKYASEPDLIVDEIYQSIKHMGINGRQIPWGPVEKWLTHQGRIYLRA